MSVKPVRALLLCCCTGLMACASVPQEMHYFDPQAAGVMAVWPTAPEVPRYRFAGELVGAPNFTAERDKEPGALMTALRWITGLDESDTTNARSLLRPQSGMVDASGRIYVTDSGRQAVFVFDESAAELSIWKRADAGDNFATPVGVAPGNDEEILVADATLARVVRLGADGAPLGSFGAGELGRPTGLARDGSGRLYVADSREHDVKVFDLDGRLLKRIGRRGTGAGEFNAPTHLTVATDRLYVADTLNARVQSLTLDGDPVQSYGRRGLYVGNLIRPKGIAVDTDDNLYIVESYFDHLLVFGDDGQFLLPIGGHGSAAGQFFLPAGAWSDARGRIFVADMFNGRVAIFLRLGEDVSPPGEDV